MFILFFPFSGYSHLMRRTTKMQAHIPGIQEPSRTPSHTAQTRPGDGKTGSGLTEWSNCRPECLQWRVSGESKATRAVRLRNWRNQVLRKVKSRRQQDDLKIWYEAGLPGHSLTPKQLAWYPLPTSVRGRNCTQEVQDWYTTESTEWNPPTST